MARTSAGYSLAEVMVGLVILGIVVAAGVPNVSSYLRSQASANGADQIGAHLRMARSRAIMEGNDYLVQFVDTSHYLIVDDDGGDNGIPGAPQYVATNRGNGRADAGEARLGPFALPRGLEFASAAGTVNPFDGQPVESAVTFPVQNGRPTLVFHANGTAEDGGFVTVAPSADVARDQHTRCRVLQVLSSTGGVQSLPARVQG